MKEPSINCRNCGGTAIASFHQVRAIPAHSVVLIPDRETALSYPKRDLRLGFCSACGFIANTVFDPTVQQYSTQYEDTQGFSPTFTAFAKSLARSLIDQHGLAGKSVLEIGCGKGEFIALLCELGMRRGIGIDPTYLPGRLTGEGAARVEFIQDFYGEKYAHLQADLICCRHTLEHIAATGDFLRTLRRNIGDRPGTLVFFEVPDTYRILREAAFWDIYYEHCSYFTAGSLARLFRQSGFDLIELRLAYDGQYLTVVAKPAEKQTPPRFEIEDDVVKVTEAVAQFPERFSGSRRKWMDTINDWNRQGQKVVLWGSGSKAVAFITTLGLTANQIEYVVDINPYKQNKYMPGTGQRIVPPRFLEEYRPDCLIVMNPVYSEEIRADLARMGLKPMVLLL